MEIDLINLDSARKKKIVIDVAEIPKGITIEQFLYYFGDTIDIKDKEDEVRAD